MNTSIIDSTAEFHSLRNEWNKLENNFCVSWQWLMTWWEKIGQNNPSNQLCVVKLQEGDQLLGIAPLYVDRNRVFGRTLKFLGNGGACSDYMTFPTREGHEQHMADALLETIRHRDFAKRVGDIDLIELEGHTQKDLAVNSFVESATESGFEIESRELEGCWKVEIPSDWEEFRKRIKKSQRRKINKVDRHAQSGEFVTSYFMTAAEIQEAWPSFVELHQKRRKQLGQQGCFANSEFDHFLLAAAMRLADTGRTLMTMIHHRGKPFGAVLCFTSGDCLCVYQSGLDTDNQKHEPGHYANTMTFRVAQERGFDKLDFLRGDEPYKANWGCERTALVRTRLVAPKFTAQLRHRLFISGRTVRTWTQEFWNRSRTEMTGSNRA